MDKISADIFGTSVMLLIRYCVFSLSDLTAREETAKVPCLSRLPVRCGA